MKKGIIILIVLTGVLILSFDKVNALEYTTEVSYYATLPNSYSNTDLEVGTWGLFKYKQFNPPNSATPISYEWDFTNQITSNDFDFIEIPYMISYQELANYSEYNNQYCSRWRYREDGGYECAVSSQYSTHYPGALIGNAQITAFLSYTDGSYSICSVGDNTIMCPYYHRTARYINVFISTKDNTNGLGDNFYFYMWTQFNVYKLSGTQSIIDNQNQNTQEIINQNATYENTPDQDLTNETQEVEQYHQAEENLINSLDLNMSVMDGISINPNASAYIWNIVDRLRMINPAIILLMTSILGMGIIKMVLNR